MALNCRNMVLSKVELETDRRLETLHAVPLGTDQSFYTVSLLPSLFHLLTILLYIMHHASGVEPAEPIPASAWKLQLGKHGTPQSRKRMMLTIAMTTCTLPLLTIRAAWPRTAAGERGLCRKNTPEISTACVNICFPLVDTLMNFYLLDFRTEPGRTSSIFHLEIPVSEVARQLYHQLKKLQLVTRFFQHRHAVSCDQRGITAADRKQSI